MNESRRPSHADRTPDDLLPIESSLERLARAERGSARSGLEDRLFAATRAPIARAAAPRTLRFPGSWPMRLAAAVALIAGVGLAVWSWRSGGVLPPTTPLDPIASNRTTPVDAEPSDEDPIDAELLREELDALVSSYEAVERAELANAAPISESFWDATHDLPEEDPSR